MTLPAAVFLVVAFDGLVKANLIENPSFEQTWSRDGESQRFVTAWQMFMMEYDHLPDPGFGRTGESCFVMRHEDAGDPWRAVGQSIFVTQKTPLQLELSCWVAGFDLSAPAAVALDIEYADGTFRFDKAAHSPTGTFAWTQLSVSIPASKPIRSIFVYASSISNPDTAAFFDDFELYATPVAEENVEDPESPTCPGDHVCWGDIALPAEAGRVQGEEQPSRSDITLATQMTVDRIYLLPHIARNWDGPVSVAVFLRDPAEEQRVQRLLQSSADARRWVSVHIVHNTSAMFDYPINVLRNVAWDHARTDYIFNVDADFVPVPGAHATLRAEIAAKKQRDPGAPDTSWALVVPAFEFLSMPHVYNVKAGDTLDSIAHEHGISLATLVARNKITDPDSLQAGQLLIIGASHLQGAAEVEMLPRDKAGLREMARERLVQPVHKDKFFGAHKATQFQRWLSTDSQYSIAGGPVFEPYMVVHRDVPQYSPRFIGYGLDKVSHSHELGLIDGFDLVVAAEPFVVHIDHGVAKWGQSHSQNRTRVYAGWYGFIYSTEKAYGHGQFYTGPSLLQERNMPPLYHTEEEARALVKPTHFVAGKNTADGAMRIVSGSHPETARMQEHIAELAEKQGSPGTTRGTSSQSDDTPGDGGAGEGADVEAVDKALDGAVEREGEEQQAQGGEEEVVGDRSGEPSEWDAQGAAGGAAAAEAAVVVRGSAKAEGEEDVSTSGVGDTGAGKSAAYQSGRVLGQGLDGDSRLQALEESGDEGRGAGDEGEEEEEEEEEGKSGGRISQGRGGVGASSEQDEGTSADMDDFEDAEVHDTDRAVGHSHRAAESEEDAAEGASDDEAEVEVTRRAHTARERAREEERADGDARLAGREEAEAEEGEGGSTPLSADAEPQNRKEAGAAQSRERVRNVMDAGESTSSLAIAELSALRQQYPQCRALVGEVIQLRRGICASSEAAEPCVQSSENEDVSRLRDRLQKQQEARREAEEARERARLAMEAATQRAAKAEENAARLNLSVEAARDAARSAREAAKAATSSKSLGEADLARERSEARAARRAKELAVREAEDVERRAIASEARAERCMERERAAVDSGRDSRDSRDRARRDASELRAELDRVRQSEETSKSQLLAATNNATFLARGLSRARARVSSVLGERDAAREQLTQALDEAAVQWEKHRAAEMERHQKRIQTDWWVGMTAAVSGIGVLFWLTMRGRGHGRKLPMRSREV